MEPAVERREHVDTNRSHVAYLATPQWSPPLDGGSTYRLMGRPLIVSEPQWSPPLNGGSTARKSCAV